MGASVSGAAPPRPSSEREKVLPVEREEGGAGSSTWTRSTWGLQAPEVVRASLYSAHGEKEPACKLGLHPETPKSQVTWGMKRDVQVAVHSP